MKKSIIFALLMITAIFILLVLFLHKQTETLKKVDDKSNLRDSQGYIYTLWDNTVKQYLEEELWLQENAYDAGHVLMTPLHAAFILDNSTWVKQFSDHFRRFMNAIDKNYMFTNTLTELQYLYLASQFIVLAKESGQESLIPDGLVDYLKEAIRNKWEKEPAWQWGRDPFNGGIHERLLWKLSVNKTDKNYYRAIIDEELFLFAITADIFAYERMNGAQPSPIFSEILNVAYKVFRDRSVFNELGGWLFQPGYWEDHPDYAYAGHMKKGVGLSPEPVNGISMDSSHSHRFPLWLNSLKKASKQDRERQIFYEKLLEGLFIQLRDVVLVFPTTDFNGYRITNYMDGNNGLYRWGYPTQGKENGYGPYELSGTIMLGWWSFLKKNEIKEMYDFLYNKFPLPSDVVQIYVGPNTNRDRHHLVKLPNFYENGFAELITKCATVISNK